MNYKVIIPALLLILNSCGYKIVNQNYFKNYKILEINVTGDKRVAYLIRNKLNTGNQSGAKSIKLDINTKKIKNIKEKNIQNEITKYEITLSTEISFYLLENGLSGKFSISKNGDYFIEDKYSDTLNNEKKLVKNLVNDISEQILRNLQIKIDEL